MSTRKADSPTVAEAREAFERIASIAARTFGVTLAGDLAVVHAYFAEADPAAHAGRRASSPASSPAPSSTAGHKGK